MKKLIYFTTLLFAISLTAEIVEVQNINDLPRYVTKETLVIFDIDNTLLRTRQFLGSDMWFCAQYKRNFQESNESGKALEKTIREYLPIMNVSPMCLPEESAPDVVRELQNDFISVMGLTSRSLSLANRTLAQLDINGIHLERTPPSRGELHFMNVRGVLLRDGVLFTSGTSKGEALKKFLDAIGYHPKRILFINDKLGNLRDLEKGCIDRKIPFIGLRYGALDEWVRSYSQKIADIQSDHFGKILSDREAQELF